MFSREESKRRRQEFWTNFGKRSDRKWMLYDTKVKEINLKFHFDTKTASLGFMIDAEDKEFENYYFEKFESLKVILKDEISTDLIFDSDYETESGKRVGFIYLLKENVSIHNKNTWEEVAVFFETYMPKMELFFIEYKDFIES